MSDGIEALKAAYVSQMKRVYCSSIRGIATPEDCQQWEADADRGIAKIKADALREAARDMRAQVERATEHQRFTEHELVESGVEHVLNEYADRIEEEARG